jgi:hypothetical protein
MSVESQDEPISQMRLQIGNNHPEEGIKITDEAGQLVAIVIPCRPDALRIAQLFVTAPGLAYGLGRARRQLRAIVQKKAQPEDEGTRAVRQLLRDLHEQLTSTK